MISISQRHINLRKRALILRAIRDYFDHNGFIEVETPVRIPAPAPEPHIDPIESGSWYLQTSPELCMKRLVASGMERIYQICRCFRSHERGQHHLPEMTLLEWYCRGETYLDLMTRCQNLIRHIAGVLKTGGFIHYHAQMIHLNDAWETITVENAFNKFTSIGLASAIKENKFDEIMSFEIEPNLGKTRPTFLMDYPAQYGALARLKPDNPSVAERFELYIAGIELANGFTELTDPVEQRHRFSADLAKRIEAGKRETPLPEPFLEALSFLPETAGIALGIDRLIMLFTNTASIDEVVAFTPESL